jgi:hypothetical protein
MFLSATNKQDSIEWCNNDYGDKAAEGHQCRLESVDGPLTGDKPKYSYQLIKLLKLLPEILPAIKLRIYSIASIKILSKIAFYHSPQHH